MNAEVAVVLVQGLEGRYIRSVFDHLVHPLDAADHFVPGRRGWDGNWWILRMRWLDDDPPLLLRKHRRTLVLGNLGIRVHTDNQLATQSLGLAQCIRMSEVDHVVARGKGRERSGIRISYSCPLSRPEFLLLCVPRTIEHSNTTTNGKFQRDDGDYTLFRTRVNS